MLSGESYTRFRFYTRIVQRSYFLLAGLDPITRSFIVGQLNRTLRVCNLDPALYKSHSFRISAATWATPKGFSDSQIRQLGRWKSNAFLKYIRVPSLSTDVSSP